MVSLRNSGRASLESLMIRGVRWRRGLSLVWTPDSGVESAKSGDRHRLFRRTTKSRGRALILYFHPEKYLYRCCGGGIIFLPLSACLILASSMILSISKSNSLARSSLVRRISRTTSSDVSSGAIAFIVLNLLQVLQVCTGLIIRVPTQRRFFGSLS